MPGTPVKVGPFTGGLNTYSDTTAVADNEAVELVNFDIDIDGSLVTRPPICFEVATPGPNLPLRLLGYYTSSNNENYLIASVARGFTNGTYVYYNGAWSVITDTIPATAFVQYGGKAWLVAPPGSANPGGSWDPVTGFVPIAAMKKGSAALVYKERMFIGEGGTAVTSSRVSFSNPGNFSVWNTSDFVDIKSGDGQDIIDMILYADTIVVLKQDSTYIFSYDTKPAAGQVRQISSTIGVAGKDCIFEYENNLYLLHGKSVYTMLNWNYQVLNLKVPLQRVNSKPNELTVPFVLSRINDRLILRYYDTYYVYGLKTQSWVVWTTPRSLGKFIQVPIDTVNLTPDKFLAVSTWTTVESMYSFIEGYTIEREENYQYSVVSKTFDFESPFTYKRLFWWGADAISKNQFTATVFPISYGRTFTWDEAKLRTWDQAKQFTWDHPADVMIREISVRDGRGTNNRTFIKFLKSLRFRQVNFKISGSTDGRLPNAPYRLFGITAFVDLKAKVSQTVN
jgi:hypothetical protein